VRKKAAGSGNTPSAVVGAPFSVLRPSFAPVRPLLFEKLPFFVFSVVSCIVTFVVQQKGGAVGSLHRYSMGVRIANAFVAYCIYMAKTLWPNNLSVFYPYPSSLPVWQVFGAVLLVTSLTVISVWKARKLPCLACGWLWFAGTLVPVIGIVQVGDQAMADRYTYIPLIGLFIILAWGVPELLKKWPRRKEALAASSALALSCLLILTWTQVGYWRNSIALYDHALKITNRNDLVHCNRGLAYNRLGNYRYAIEDFDRAIEINPYYQTAYINRGTTNRELDNITQAISDYSMAIGINPKVAAAYDGRGVAYVKAGNIRQAIDDFDRAIAIDPGYAGAYVNRGATYLRLGNHRQAISDFDRAVTIDPGFAAAYVNRGMTCTEIGDFGQAISDYSMAIRINPGYAIAYANRGGVYLKLGDLGQGIEDIKTAAKLDNEWAKNFLKSQGISW